MAWRSRPELTSDEIIGRLSAMAFERAFLRRENFDLAFRRLVRAQNPDYKALSRHLLEAYQLSATEDGRTLALDIREQSYRASRPIPRYLPKRDGGIRPIRILTLRDQHVYQAISNVVAERVRGRLRAHVDSRRFGTVLAGNSDDFFFRSWRVGYRSYWRSLLSAYESGLQYVGELDLVSFYDSVDHQLLRRQLSGSISDDLLELLMTCLTRWTSPDDDQQRGFGLPQGPEASSLLAEILLLPLDAVELGTARFARYSDNITVLADSEGAAHRALLHFEVAARRLGLSPHGWRESIRKIHDKSELTARIPSGLARDELLGFDEKRTQASLRRMLRESMRWDRSNRTWTVLDDAQFRFALHRMNPRRDTLRRVLRLVPKHPHLSWVVSQYAREFGRDSESAQLIADALLMEPHYSDAVADLIMAMDVCEPRTGVRLLRRAVNEAYDDCVERGLPVRSAIVTFRARRRRLDRRLELIRTTEPPIAASSAISRIFASRGLRDLPAARPLLEELIAHPDPDLARYAAFLLMPSHRRLGGGWSPPRRVNQAVNDLLYAVGLRGKRNSRPTVLDRFFRDEHSIGVQMRWRKALGPALTEGESLCLRFQDPSLADPTARLMALDVFNEFLSVKFSQAHPTLGPAFASATPNGRPQPNWGTWVRHGAFRSELPFASDWFEQVHVRTRESDLPHRIVISGSRRGARTTRVRHEQLRKLMKPAQRAWAELIREWRRLV